MAVLWEFMSSYELLGLPADSLFCQKYVAQPLCGLLLFMFRLAHQPATEKSEVIIYKELK